MFVPRCARLLSTLDMQHADQREQPPRGGKIGFDLALKTIEQKFGGIVVDAAPRHVDRLDLRWGSLANRLVIAVADGEVFADRAEIGRASCRERVCQSV